MISFVLLRFITILLSLAQSCTLVNSAAALMSEFSNTMPVVKGGGAPGYRAPPNGCCAPVTVSPNYEKMALYSVHPDGAPLKSHGAPMC